MRRLNWPFIGAIAGCIAFWALVLLRVVWG
jgi:hypothetical protein